MLARLLTLLAVAAVAFVPAAGSAPTAGPTGLHAFMLRADEAPQNTFSRTPSFAWQPFEGATRYDFQLATSSRFDDRTLFWSTDSLSQPLTVPAISIPIALPWMTGSPYGLYARVRAHVGTTASRWSAPFGFNMGWNADDAVAGAPQQILPDVSGLVRWTPIDGATSYQVWFNPDNTPGTVVSTTTNVADERDAYDPAAIAASGGSFGWKVRAVRQIYGNLPNALPRTTYGPWSQTFVSLTPAITSGPLTPSSTVSDVSTVTGSKGAQALTPGFAFTGDTASNGQSGQFFRVYVSTDSRCVNIVYTGAVVASPAYAPRTSAQGIGAQAGKMADGETATPNEGGAAVDLWDLGAARGNARFWWTVVPVTLVNNAYVDLQTPQEACDAGRVMQFTKSSAPVTASSTRPYASGLSRYGEMVAAQVRRPSFSRSPLIAWEPAKGATSYEVQWSHTLSPWKAQLSLATPGTSVLVQSLAPGTWYYRVRGVDANALGVKEMTWSTPIRISIAKPRFFVQSNVTTTRVKK